MVRPLEEPDAAWPPATGSDHSFQEKVTSKLCDRGYCVLDYPQLSSLRSAVLREVRQRDDFELWPEELAESYLGKDSFCEVAKLSDDPFERPIPGGALDRLEQEMDQLMRALQPALLELGLSPGGRTHTLLRQSGPHMPRTPFRWSDKECGRVEEMEDFLERRTISALLLVECQGGVLELSEEDEDASRHVPLALSKDRIFLFRHDHFHYGFYPTGRYLALQVWLLGPVGEKKPLTLPTDPQEILQAIGISGPLQPVSDAEPCKVQSLMVRMPGSVVGPEHLYAMFTQGTDTAVHWPSQRWETEPYYSEDTNAAALGKTYSVHGAFMDFTEVSCFDRHFFGISYEDAFAMAPEQRLVLETGYEALALAGYTRKSVQGLQLGVYLGDVGSEEILAPPYVSHSEEGLNGSATAGRLSYLLGLTGPTMGLDTACSSSIMALGFAHWKLRGCHDERLPGAIVAGINLHMTPARYIFLGSGGFLTRKGRCFTFDTSAEGYCRGEGSGASVLQQGQEGSHLDERLATVVGTALNQDGRSASLTAPNGPSQQAVIRTSLRMANVIAEEVGAAECHGTGTALGDPIEIGAIVSALGKRTSPLTLTTHKTNMGHPEACAGMAGLAKCVFMTNRCVALPNVHLKSLSPHLHLEGFPHLIVPEVLDFGVNSQNAGVSSFGFGGSNGRADLWGRSENKLTQLSHPSLHTRQRYLA